MRVTTRPIVTNRGRPSLPRFRWRCRPGDTHNLSSFPTWRPLVAGGGECPAGVFCSLLPAPLTAIDAALPPPPRLRRGDRRAASLPRFRGLSRQLWRHPPQALCRESVRYIAGGRPSLTVLVISSSRAVLARPPACARGALKAPAFVGGPACCAPRAGCRRCAKWSTFFFSSAPLW